MRLLLPFLFCFVIGNVYSKQDTYSKIDELIKSYINLNWFSGSILIKQGNNVLYENVFGMANYETGSTYQLNTTRLKIVVMG